MKKLILLLPLLLCAPFTLSVEYEVGVKTIYIEQKLFGTIEFIQPTMSIVGNVWFDNGFGLGATVGVSDEADNKKRGVVKYTNTIKLLTSYSVMFKHAVYDNVEVFADVGITDYRTLWTVNGERPEWARGVDSDIHYGVGIRYIMDNLTMSFSYVDYYRSSDETTVGYSITLTSKF